MTPASTAYRGRIAPSPTGHLHLGHARTFWTAQQRARAAGGTLIYRNDDLDAARCRPEFHTAAMDDLRWFGLEWSEGPDIGGPFAPYSQSERLDFYRAAFERLRHAGAVFPCSCSRREIASALSAPHPSDEEPVYPGTCRAHASIAREMTRVSGMNWRFRVPDKSTVEFKDGRLGQLHATAGVDFGDVLVWRKDDFPSYQLACVVDDALMGITEVVRGEDLVTSTFRQILLYNALGWIPPRFYHCEIVRDHQGVRLAKRHDSLSLRALRENNRLPADLH